MKRRTLSCLFLGIALVAATATNSCQSTNVAAARRVSSHHGPRVEAVDAEHYALELWLMPETHEITGMCTLSYAVVWGDVDVVELELEGLNVDGVWDGEGTALTFDHDDGILEIDLASPLSVGDLGQVVVSYSGAPVKGLWFVNDADDQVRHVFTQGECVDSHWWFPCLDYPADRSTSDLRVHMPAAWTAVAAGERIDLVESAEERVEHWRMTTPHPVYLTSLCAGEFTVIEDEWDGIPLMYLSDPVLSDWMEASFSETPDVLAYFSELTGKRYPYAKYAQTCVGNFPFGGMENISATTVTENTLTDELGQLDGTSVGLVAHEAAHQWFGDLMTCSEWSEIWLNEGFATYLTALYFEETRGVDEFRVRMRNAHISYTAADIGVKRRPTVHDFYLDPFDLFFDGKAYAGAASRLHLLRFELGDDLFFKGLRLYVAENEGRAVRTEDFQEAMETVSERDLSLFFDQWLHGAGYPELEVDWSWDEDQGEVELTVEQVQKATRGTPAIFHLVVDVELRNARGKTTSRIALDERKQSFLFPSASRPIWLRFDKHSYLPARIASTKSGSEWIAIAAEDDDVNGRRDAVDALGRLCATEEDPDKAAVLGTAVLRRLRDDSSEAVRLEAIEALGRMGGEDTRGFLETAAMEDQSAAVRVAALGVLLSYAPDAELALFADSIFDAGYSWNVKIAAARLYASADPGVGYDWIVARADIPSPHAKLRAGLIAILAGIPDERVLVILRDLAGREDVATATRQAAVDGLATRGRKDRQSRDLLLDLLDTDEYRLRQAVIGALAGFDDQTVMLRLRKELATSPYSPERRKLEDAIGRLGGR
ncbi:MAG: aminopeptidase N [Planctomycetota bacterium]|jgi:aminopeptidase N